MQRAYLRSQTSLGEPLVACLFRDPVSMSSGKTAAVAYSAATDFFPLLREIGHKGICISAYTFDRALQAPTARLLHQHHQRVHATAGADKTPLPAIDCLTDWTLTTACASHDCQNGLKWAMARHVEGEDLKDLYVVLESLRNGFDAIHGHIVPFVAKFLRVTCEAFDREEAYAFWNAMGVEPDMANLLADLDLKWVESDDVGYLSANTWVMGDAEVANDVISSLLYLFKWRKFTDSRWLTIGVACRSIVAGLSVGLEMLAKLTRDDPSTSDFYLHGVGRLSARLKNFCVVASLPVACATLCC